MKRSMSDVGACLRVVVWENEQGWMAQGLEIDYAACGDSKQDVIERFVTGLTVTLEENYRIFGHANNVLKPAPPEYWQPFLTGRTKPNLSNPKGALKAALKRLANGNILPPYLTSLQLYSQIA